MSEERQLTPIEKARAKLAENQRLRAEGKLPPLERKRKKKAHKVSARVAQGSVDRTLGVPQPVWPAEVTHVAITDTPEFKAAVAAAAAEILAKVSQARGTIAPGDHEWAEILATKIAEVGNQGTGNVVVDPKVIAYRKACNAKMVELLIAARAEPPEKAPIYTLVGKVQIDIPGQGPTLIDPLQRSPKDNQVRPARIRHWDPPNEAMRPDNETAKAIYEMFLASISNDTKAPTHIKAPDGTEMPVPPNGGYIETNFALTPEGHAVTGLSAAQISSAAREERQRTARYGGILVDEKGEPFSINNGGPPYVDVNVLGSIAPPARQNG